MSQLRDVTGWYISRRSFTTQILRNRPPGRFGQNVWSCSELEATLPKSMSVAVRATPLALTPIQGHVAGLALIRQSTSS